VLGHGFRGLLELLGHAGDRHSFQSACGCPRVRIPSTVGPLPLRSPLRAGVMTLGMSDTPTRPAGHLVLAQQFMRAFSSLTLGYCRRRGRFSDAPPSFEADLTSRAGVACARARSGRLRSQPSIRHWSRSEPGPCRCQWRWCGA
jgi:hypothetical protein